MAFDAGIEREPSQLERDLTTAKGLIARYGWTQRDMGDRERGFCVLGALMWAISERTTGFAELSQGERYRSATEAMQHVGPFGKAVSVPAVNDYPTMTKKMVLGWFDRAIAAAQGEPVQAPEPPAYPGCTCPSCKPNWGYMPTLGPAFFNNYQKNFAKALEGV